MSLREQNIPVSGPMIKTVAPTFYWLLGIKDFKASSGWLNKFKIWHDLNFKKLT